MQSINLMIIDDVTGNVSKGVKNCFSFSDLNSIHRKLNEVEVLHIQPLLL